MVIWMIDLTMIAAAITLVLIWELNAAIVGGVMIAVIVLAHLVFNQRVCLDCGAQWRPR